MRLSHHHKFLFLSKPRCASESIRKTLDPYSDIKSRPEYPYHHHASALEMKHHFEEQNWDWDSYFKFISIRNPWAMIVSIYYYGKPDVNGLYWWVPEKNGIPYQPDTRMEFKTWVRSNDFYYWTLNRFILDENGNSLVNEIIKVEELEDGLNRVMQKIGLGKYKSYRINATHHSPYRDYYDEETQKWIASCFELDIETGKYLF